MCGRYTQTASLEILQERFGFRAPGLQLKPRYNLAPGQDAPVVLVDGSERRLKLLRWGLVPSWAKEGSAMYKMVNARAETVAERASFRKPLAERRCLVLADGFYEWERGTGGTRLPRRFTLRSKEPFAMAGLWDVWRSPQGRVLESFTIVTTLANAEVLAVHERMPVILTREGEAAWLDPANREAARLLPLLVPLPDGMLGVRPVSARVNSPHNDDPQCLEGARRSPCS